MISEEDRADILSSLRIGIALDKAARAMGTTAAACIELAGRDPQWAADMAAAEREGKPAEVAPMAVSWADLEKITREREQVEAVETKPAAPRAQGTALDPRVIVPTLAQGEDIPDWQRFADEAEAEFGPGRMGLYLKQDARLVAGGMPAATPWWRWTISEFLASELTWLIAMVGRGAGKSTNLERLLMLIAIWTRRFVPPGQPWTAPFMSVVSDDAMRRIQEVSKLIQIAYHVEGKIKGSAIKVADCCGNNIDIVSTAGTIAQASGPSTVAAFFDEFAKMIPLHAPAGSDSELVASIVGTSRELEGWIGVRCSSAWETRGLHFENCMEGTNSENFVASIGIDFIDAALAGYEDVARWEHSQGNTHGAAQIRSFAKTLHPKSPNIATWVARPTLTAMKSRMKLETLGKDNPALEGLSRFDFWIREYGSMPLSREGGPDFAAQCELSAAMTARLAGRPRGALPPGVNANGLLINPNAPPGDARYGGPTSRDKAPSTHWRSRKVF